MDIRGEVTGGSFGDERLSKRFARLAEQLARNPAESFPKAVGSDAALEATYRFLGNEAVTPEAVLQPHIAATVTRCRQVRTVLVAHDTSEFRFSGEREDLGRLSSDSSYGFLGHFALAVAPFAADSTVRSPLGVLGVETFFRERGPHKTAKRDKLPMAQKESGRWLDLVERVEPLLEDVVAVHVMDREADAYELMAGLVAGKHRFIIRLQVDRATQSAAGRGRISDALRKAKTVLERDVDLSERKRGPRDPPKRTKKHPPRKARVAKLAISGISVSLRRPQHLDTSLPETLALNIVYVREVGAPPGAEPVEWRLITTEPIDSSEDIAAVVDGYRARWVIEEYFRALKQGCGYEKRQLESRHALLNALAVFTPIAWQLLALRPLSRQSDKIRAEKVLSAMKIMLLQRHPDVRLGKNPTVKEALLAVARLGGHIKNNGDPGWLVLGRGFEDLLLLERGAVLAIGTCDQS